MVDSVGQTGSDGGLPDVSAVPTEEPRARSGEPFTLPGTGDEGSWRVLTTAREDGGVFVTAQFLGWIEDPSAARVRSWPPEWG